MLESKGQFNQSPKHKKSVELIWLYWIM